MELTHDILPSAASSNAPGIVPFDVLRALITARQAATPTARVVAAAEMVCPPHNFAALFIGDSPFAGAVHDRAVSAQDERHG